MTALAIVLGVLLDRFLGEVPKFHPLVGFGVCANRVEKYCNRWSSTMFVGVVIGGVSWLLLVSVFVMLIVIFKELLSPIVPTWLIDALLVYFAIGYKSLLAHAQAVIVALKSNDLAEARNKLARFVSRDTQNLTPSKVCAGATESVLENGSDAVFAPLFWFILAGAPGVVMYRLANTLDAMWGYRTKRFQWFGYLPAKIDDVLNFIPARMVAFSYALLGNTRQALQCWKWQAKGCASPNGGPVMCSGAGAMNVRLGGENYYHGVLVNKPEMGVGCEPNVTHIILSQELVSKTLILWLIIIVIGSGVNEFL